MEKYRFWIIISLVSLLFAFFVKYEDFQAPSADMAIAGTFGYAFSLLIYPGILALIVGGIYKLFGKEFNKKSFKSTFLVAWVIILLFSFIGNLSDVNATTDRSEYDGPNMYEANRNEYVVAFPNEPDISQNIFFESALESETAELVLPDVQSMLRAETFIYTDEINMSFSDEETIKIILEEHITTNGLSHSELRFENSDFGKKAEVRGFKTLRDYSENYVDFTFGIHAYFGEVSGIILTGASPSSIYPTPEISKFLNSIQRKDITPSSRTQSPSSNKNVDFLTATEKGDLNELRKILDSGIDIHTIDENGNTALHIAATRDYYEICKLLIENGADVNYRGLYNGVALADAAARGYTNIVELLIENNADVNAQGTYGASPLSLAVSLGQYQTSKILLENGADPDLPDIMGDTPRSLAEEKADNKWKHLFN